MLRIPHCLDKLQVHEVIFSIILLQFSQSNWECQNEITRSKRKLFNCVFFEATWSSNFSKWYLQSFHDHTTYLISVTDISRKFMMDNMLLSSHLTLIQGLTIQVWSHKHTKQQIVVHKQSTSCMCSFTFWHQSRCWCTTSKSITRPVFSTVNSEAYVGQILPSGPVTSTLWFCCSLAIDTGDLVGKIQVQGTRYKTQ
jgi:hypothetical protein